MKKNILFSAFVVFGLGFMLLFNSCKNCDGESPRARIINNGTDVASVQIKTSGGNTENLNNVEPGQTSEFRSYDAGTITFTLTINKMEYVKEVPMSSCYEYDILIDANNNISTASHDRND